MKINRYICPHSIKVWGNSISIYSKNGRVISEGLRIKRLGIETLKRLAYSMDGIVRDENGNITMVYLYERDSDTITAAYLFRYRLLGNLTENQIV
jgi:hypothetical protein